MRVWIHILWNGRKLGNNCAARHKHVARSIDRLINISNLDSGQWRMPQPLSRGVRSWKSLVQIQRAAQAAILFFFLKQIPFFTLFHPFSFFISCRTQEGTPSFVRSFVSVSYLLTFTILLNGFCTFFFNGTSNHARVNTLVLKVQLCLT